MTTTQFKSNFDLIEIDEVIIRETEGTSVVSPLVFTNRMKDPLAHLQPRWSDYEER